MSDANLAFLRSLADLAAFRAEEHQESAAYFATVERKVNLPLDPVAIRLEELAQGHRTKQEIWSLVRGQILNHLARTGTPYSPTPNENLLYGEDETP
jgi:hypothetical protein